MRAGTPGPRPGGTPEEISREPVRLRGRRPRKPCRLAPCPNGASKKMARGDEGWRKCSGDAAAENFFDAPLGHGLFGGATGGRARGAGLPPANFLRSPSGTKSQVSATILQSSAGGPAEAKPSRRARIRPSRSTEKTKDSLGERRSLIDDFLEPTPSPGFLCVHRVSVVFFPVSTEEKRLGSRQENHPRGSGASNWPWGARSSSGREPAT